MLNQSTVTQPYVEPQQKASRFRFDSERVSTHQRDKLLFVFLDHIWSKNTLYAKTEQLWTDKNHNLRKPSPHRPRTRSSEERRDPEAAIGPQSFVFSK